jgi:endonuclease YncB( thermonuclease family)
MEGKEVVNMRILVVMIVGAIVAGVSAAVHLTAKESYRGKVISVVDGDTLKMMNGGKRITIRFWGIDAPETAQRFGAVSKMYAESLCMGREVEVVVRGGDRYGRTIGDIRLSDGRRVADVMVQAGMAWWYRQYAGHEKGLQAYEAEAKAARRGLWSDDKPVAPWNYRHMRTRGYRGGM